MAKVEGLTLLVKNIKKLEAKMVSTLAKKGAGGSVIVGYTASYALWVHEMIKGAPHPPKSNAQRRAMFASIREREARGHVSWEVGQPKFLEQPARTQQREMRAIVNKAVMEGKTMIQALLLAGLYLQAESQRLCPIDTGNLRASAFTKIE